MDGCEASGTDPFYCVEIGGAERMAATEEVWATGTERNNKIKFKS